MTDPIADFLTRIRNASRVGKREVRMPYAKLLDGIAELFVSEGFLESVDRKGRGHKRSLVVTLRYLEGKPIIDDIRRISRPGRRVYRSSGSLRNVKSGFGIAVLSTPKGLLTNREAKKQRVGGEVLCEIW